MSDFETGYLIGCGAGATPVAIAWFLCTRIWRRTWLLRTGHEWGKP